LERLYRHHSTKTGRVSLPTHFAVALFDTLKQFPRPATFTSLVGRFVGAIEHLRPVDEDNGLTSDPEPYADVAAQNAA
jgi:hypothetical protein